MKTFSDHQTKMKIWTNPQKKSQIKMMKIFSKAHLTQQLDQDQIQVPHFKKVDPRKIRVLQMITNCRNLQNS